MIAIQSGGGDVMYDWQLARLPNGNVRFDRKGRSKAPKWLFDALGPEYFGHVESVILGQNTGAVIEQVGKLDKLQRVSFRRGIDLTPLAKAGLESLPNAGLSRFRGLAGLMTAESFPTADSGG